MRKALLAMVALIAVTGTAALLTGNPLRVAAANVPVEVGDFYFCNASFQGGVCETTIAAGDNVVWTVASGSHTVTECDSTYTTCPPAGGFNSGMLNQSQTFERTFNSPGTFYYYCSFHPEGMRGRIVVQAQATATATPTPGPTATASPTAAAGATATPTRSATPAAVPATGGDPSGGDDGLGMELLLAIGAAAIAASALALRHFQATRRP